MIINGLDKIYIIHYAPLKERKKYLERKLKELGLENYTEWIISCSNKDFTEKDFKDYDGSKSALDERKKVLGVDSLPASGLIDKIMVVQQIKLFKKISMANSNESSMIIEDDVLLEDDFPEKLKETLEKLNKINWDICYTDKGALFVEPKIKKDAIGKITLYNHPERGANTTGSYLINTKTAKKISKFMKRFSLAIDAELSYIQRKNNLEVYWTVPFLTRQGSIEYNYQSNVRKGSVTGMLMKRIRLIERVNPRFAKFLLRCAQSFRDLTYKSNFLMYLKDKFKKISKI